MMYLLLLFLGLIQSGSTIHCYTCNGPAFLCSLPLDVDNGEESNESDITSPYYGPGFVCQSDYYVDLRTGEERLILRGTRHCEHRNVINHRTYCCNTSNCNNCVPTMERGHFISSESRRYLGPMMLIVFSLVSLYLFSDRNHIEVSLYTE